MLIRKSFDIVILIITAMIGVVSFMFFMFFLYGEYPNIMNLEMGEAGRLTFDALLSAAFFFQHSTMIRKPFRLRLGILILPHYHGIVYAVVSGLVLLGCMTFWQRSDMMVLEVRGLLRITMRAAFYFAIAGIFWGMWALRSFDMFGLLPILRNQHGKPPSPPMPFSIRGPYRWVRHPLYLFMMILFWSNPVLTADRLLFNVLWTIWVVIGTVLEERDLSESFGIAYRNYQQRVPMLIPRNIHPAYTKK
jgi:protein-S-isoprenylcysteine O-methyltransferase Ste14